jgi:D-apionolactonase
MAEPLRAGDLQAILADGPELRDVRRLGVVILDGVALTVRDPDWGTVHGHRVSRSITTTDLVVRVSDRWLFDLSPGTLACNLDIELEPSAVLIELRTAVESTVEVNRAGLVLLHPLELLGRPVTLVSTSGEQKAHFPARVSPHQPFRDLRGMVYSAADGLTVSLDFGDAAYETEDHRNWCDAGWKSYTPPLAHPVPLRLNSGESREQRVRVAVSSDRPSDPPRQAGLPRVRISPEVSGVLPALGWGAGPLPPRLLRGLPVQPSFLSVEVLANALSRERLRQAMAQAEAWQLPLRVTVAASETEAALVAEELSRFASQISHVCFVDPGTHVSNESLVQIAATAFAGTSVAIGAGTRGYLAELGRSASGFRHAQFALLSISAEVHHDDDERIIDTTRAMPSVVDSARAVAGGLPLVVSPITLAQRLSVHGPADDAYAPWEPAVQPDRRSGEGLGEVWCLASVAGLVGADALAYFAVVPGHGLLDAAANPTPVANLLSELAEYEGRPVLRCDISDPRVVSALAVRHGDAVRLYVANLAATQVDVAVEHFSTHRSVRLEPYEVRRLSHGADASDQLGALEMRNDE